MKRRTKALLLGAATCGFALTDARAFTAAPKDYPHGPTYQGAATLHRFSEPLLYLDGARASSRAKLDGGGKTYDVSSEVTLGLVRKASPSVYWGLAVSRDRLEIKGDGGEHDTIQSTSELDSAFKIMDRIVLGLGVGYDQRREAGALGDASAGGVAWRYGFLVKGERWELGWTDTRLWWKSEDDDCETTWSKALQARLVARPDWRFSLAGRQSRAPRDGVFKGTSERALEASVEWQLGDLKPELHYVHSLGKDLPTSGVTLESHGVHLTFFVEHDGWVWGAGLMFEVGRNEYLTKRTIGTRLSAALQL